MEDKLDRWIVCITYSSVKAPIRNSHFIEELSEIDDLVEGGPHWETIEDITITLNPKRRYEGDILTVEMAEKL